MKTSVEWKSSEARFICPCHSSVFDISENVLSPPAPRALNFHPVMLDDGMVKVIRANGCNGNDLANRRRHMHNGKGIKTA
ncbi:MAG: hypothetical protein E2O79_10710 [Caldithrix sp.]|nr:MAG: hypothetical protein E2O79_10710 [Caldithrix sp.]